ncbi:hypothetical protein [Minwuia thermotolerans]|uniref:hypothetical protein n=1 Tax=Minwuia thermotolerans TaxID=2056226 RepID=UPI0019D2CE21|nr:hypothetical protein [Minwuia thermotolerans]
MTALSADRNTPLMEGVFHDLPVKAATLIHAGALVALSGAFVQQGATATGLVAVGRAEERADNSAGANGDITVRIREGVFRWANSEGGEAIAVSEIGKACWIVDDQTVAKTSNGGARSPAGIVTDVDAQGVWVRTGPQVLVSPDGALLAANDLGDVDDAAAARGNLGADKIFLNAKAADLSGTDVYRLVAPLAGDITKFRSVLDGALADGDATLTLSINGTPVTNGVITIAEAGSAAGDVDEATPTAANTVAAGDVIAITVGGANSAARVADTVLEITY